MRCMGYEAKLGHGLLPVVAVATIRAGGVVETVIVRGGGRHERAPASTDHPTGGTLMCGFKLTRPCPHCPFRKDVPPYLHGARAQEIATSLARGGEFPCHKTTEPDDDSEMVATASSQWCAGALLMLEASDAPSQAMRIAERLGIYDPAKLDRSAPVCRSTAAFVQHHAQDEDDPAPTCSVCGPGCEAPAGWLEGGSVVPNMEPGETNECDTCGEPVCETCAEIVNDDYLCETCADYERAEAIR